MHLKEVHFLRIEAGSLQYDFIRNIFPLIKDTTARISRPALSMVLRRSKNTERSREGFLPCGAFCAAIRFRAEAMIRSPEGQSILSYKVTVSTPVRERFAFFVVLSSCQMNYEYYCSG